MTTETKYVATETYKGYALLKTPHGSWEVRNAAGELIEPAHPERAKMLGLIAEKMEEISGHFIGENVGSDPIEVTETVTMEAPITEVVTVTQAVPRHDRTTPHGFSKVARSKRRKAERASRRANR